MKLKVISERPLFCLLYFIWGIYTLFELAVNITWPNEVEIGKTLNVLVAVFLLLMVIVEVFKNKTGLKWYSPIVFGIIIFLSIIAGKNQSITYLVNFLFVLAASKINYKTILKTFLAFSFLVLFITIAFNYLQFIPNFTLSSDTLERVRSSLGFSYYTFSAQLFFFFLCSFIVYKNEKITFLNLILLEIVNIFIYHNTNTRNPYLLGSILIIYCLYKKISKAEGIIKNNFLKKLFSLSFVVAIILLYLITFKLPSNLFFQLNSIFSNRLLLNLSAFQQFGVSIFGQKIQFSNIDAFGRYSSNYNYVDSAYFQNLLVNGWLFIVIIIILFTFLSIRACKEKKDYLLVVLGLIAIHAMFDPQAFLAWYSPFVLLLCNNLKDYKNTSLHSNYPKVKISNESSQKLSI